MMAWNTCFKCQAKMWIPDALNEAALAARGEIPFYCAYGHRQFYCEGDSAETVLRRERDRLKQSIAQWQDEAQRESERATLAERQAAAFKGQVTRLKKRAVAGTCSCCNRTFANMAEHMKTCHPEQIEDSGAKVVKLQRRKRA